VRDYCINESGRASEAGRGAYTKWIGRYCCSTDGETERSFVPGYARHNTPNFRRPIGPSQAAMP